MACIRVSRDYFYFHLLFISDFLFKTDGSETRPHIGITRRVVSLPDVHAPPTEGRGLIVAQAFEQLRNHLQVIQIAAAKT